MLRFGVFDAALVALPAWTLLGRARSDEQRTEARITRAGRLVGVYRLDRDARVPVGDDVVVQISRGRSRLTARRERPAAIVLTSLARNLSS